MSREVYREEKPGAYLPAKGTGPPCWHVYTGGTWYELYDFGPPRPVTAIAYGPTANREALGRPCKGYELPGRIAARINELERDGNAGEDGFDFDPLHPLDGFEIGDPLEGFEVDTDLGDLPETDLDGAP